MSHDGITLGYDWEMLVFDERLRRWAGSAIQGLVDELAKRAPWTHCEEQDGYFEHKVGVCRSLPELLERTEVSLGILRNLVARERGLLLPSGSAPGYGWFTGAHLHVGVFADPVEALRTRNALTPWMPVFATLAGNSPYYAGSRGDRKSWRLARSANGDASLRSVPDPKASAGEWGADVASRFPAPTLECRMADTPLSPRLLCECAALFAAFASHVRRHLDDARPLSPEVLADYSANRWRAAKDGLQATLAWEGRGVPAIDLVQRVLADAHAELAELGAGELVVIPAMLERRATQADFQLALLGCESDDSAFGQRLARLTAHPAAFEEWLSGTEPLPQLPLRDPVAETRAEVGGEAPRLVLEKRLPATAAQSDRAFGFPRRSEEPARPLRVAFRAMVVEPTGAPASNERAQRVCEEAVRPLVATRAFERWSGPWVEIALPVGHGAVRDGLAELDAALRDAARGQDLIYAPCGASVGLLAHAPMTVSVATGGSAADGVRRAGRLAPWLPALLALSANSFGAGSPGHGRLASGCAFGWFWPSWWSLLGTPDPETSVLHERDWEFPSRLLWRDDRLHLLIGTLDACSSPDLWAEIALLSGALALSPPDAPQEADLVERSAQRSADWVGCARDGLAATVRWGLTDMPVADVLRLAIAGAEEGLSQLGTDAGALTTIHAMLDKRCCQADLQAELLELDADDATRQARRARVATRPEAFAEWLPTAEPREARPRVDLEGVLLSAVTRETGLMQLTRRCPMPLSVQCATLERAASEGRVLAHHDLRKGWSYSSQRLTGPS